MTIHDVSKGTLELSGTGSVDVVPDVGTLRLTIVSQQKLAVEAVADNRKRASALLERATTLGIPRNDMQTEGLIVSPVYQTDPKTNVTSLVGYQASDTIALKSPVELVGKVFDACMAIADQSSGPTFGIRDPSPHRAAALQRAVSAAKTEAEIVGRAMGVTLSGPTTIRVQPQPDDGPVRIEAMRILPGATPVPPGTLSISATVEVVFEYRA